MKARLGIWIILAALVLAFLALPASPAGASHGGRTPTPPRTKRWRGLSAPVLRPWLGRRTGS